MKKSVLSFVFLFATVILIAQTVPRTMVIQEITTSTRCTYCPGAALGAEDLLTHGCEVAVIEHHNNAQGNDPFTTTASAARMTYYNVTGNPTAIFDGILRVVGGNHTQSMYSSYLPKYNTRHAVPSTILMSMAITNNGLDYTAVVTMTRIGTVTATDLRLQFVVTQSNIAYNWEGQTKLHFVNRLMIPDQEGTSINFASGETQVATLHFTMDAAWPLEDCEFISFLQDNTSREILQGIKRATVDLAPGFTANNTQINPNETVTFTNTTTGGYMFSPEKYQWYFEGATPDTSTMKNPVVTYNNCGTFNVQMIVNRGGQIDTATQQAYIQVGPAVNIVATPSDTACWYQAINLDATTAGATSYLWQPGGATTPSIDVTYAEYGIGLHNFTVTVNAEGCEQVKNVSAYLDACTGIGENAKMVTFSVYPNPSSGNFIVDMNSSKSIIADLVITNSLGATVYLEKDFSISGKTQKSLNLTNLSSGVYFLTLKNSEMKVVQKVMIR
ncbi:MAG: T9SS type A sorting domain-containing protein [Bacteroidales bacterium]|nr:T9SS type A sorting domain-containing protein [Bacteroidales bacterium]